MTDVENIRADIRHVQEQLDSIHELLNGSGGGLGLVGKVLVLWRSYVWVAGLCGVVLGSLATKLLEM